MSGTTRGKAWQILACGTTSGKGWQVLACGTTSDEWNYQREGLADFSL